MPGYYIYLVSSLPMLHFGNPPPLSFQSFLQSCQGIISDADIGIIQLCAEDKSYTHRVEQPTLKKWYAFEVALRNELVKLRAGRKHLDPHQYLREDKGAEPFVTRVAVNAVKSPSIIEAERMLDQERWQFLEELALGHYFDIDSLVIYAQKLLILEKWENIRKADRSRLLEEALSGSPH
jgi:hypothetical protein